MSVYKIVYVTYEEDGYTVKDVLKVFETDDTLQAFHVFNTSDNVLFYEVIDGLEQLTNKKSKRFNPLSVKQYYLDMGADMINVPHVSYMKLFKEGTISQQTDDSFNKLIYRLFLYEHDMKSPRYYKPIVEKAMEILVRRKV